MRAADSDSTHQLGDRGANFRTRSAPRTRCRLRNERGRAVLTTFGDGATSEGEWHESLNFAAVHRLPIVFCAKTTSGRSRRRSPKQMGAARHLQARRRLRHAGRRGRRDGSDRVLRRGEAKRWTALAPAAARRWSRPSATVFSPTRPTTTTAPTVRRDEVEARRKDDPVPCFERFLVEQAILTAEGAEALKRSVLAEANEATDRAEACRTPPRTISTTKVYADGWQPWQYDRRAATTTSC